MIHKKFEELGEVLEKLMNSDIITEEDYIDVSNLTTEISDLIEKEDPEDREIILQTMETIMEGMDYLLTTTETK